MTRFDLHLATLLAAADQWDRAAELARSHGDFSTAFDCTVRAARCRYLADDHYDNADAAELFNEADLPAATQGDPSCPRLEEESPGPHADQSSERSSKFRQSAVELRTPR